MKNTPWFGGSGGAYPTPYYGNGGASPSAYYPSAEASSLPDGGTVVGGALLFFLGVSLFKHAKEDGFSLGNPFNHHPKFDKPVSQTYKPSYYGVAGQRERVSYVTNVPEGKKGQQYSNALLDLENQTRNTTSLQEALKNQKQKGYKDFIVDDGTPPHREWGVHHGVQSTQSFKGFKKEDNENPHKPRYVLCIGSNNKTDQFSRFNQNVQEEYNVPANHLFRASTTTASIESQLKRIKELSANQPHAEIVIVAMPDHSNRDKPRDESAPEGAHHITFWDEATKASKVTESAYKNLLSTYLGSKKTLTIFSACRAGSIVA
jgi:hypothetical protein